MISTCLHEIATGDDAILRTLYHRSCQLISVLLLPAALVVAFFSKELLRVWTRNPLVVEHSHTLVKALKAVPSLGICEDATLLQVVGDSVNSEIKSGFHYPSFAAGLEGTRAPSTIGPLRQNGNLDGTCLGKYLVFVQEELLTGTEILDRDARAHDCGGRDEPSAPDHEVHGPRTHAGVSATAARTAGGIVSPA